MKMTYWISTILISIFLLWSAFSYVYSKPAIEGFKELGFPNFFRIQLVILKVLAAIVILVPIVPIQVKEWAYAGIALFLITAIVAHMAHKDPLFITLINVVFIVILIISNIFLHKNNAIL